MKNQIILAGVMIFLFLTPAFTQIPSNVTLGVNSMESFRNKNTVVMNDYICIKVSDMESIMRFRQSIPLNSRKDSARDMILYINGNPMYDIKLFADRGRKCFTCKLNRESGWLKQFNPQFTYMFSSIPATFRIGFKNGIIIDSDTGSYIYMRYISGWAIWCVAGLLVFIIGAFIYLANRTTLIRSGGLENDQFSLALTQLSFWTIIIVMSYFYIWIATENLVIISGSTLILLGISISTTAGAKLVDRRRNVPREMLRPSQGFFKDIMSDEDGPSVNRCQMIVWTFVLMIIFVTKVVTDQQMPQLDSGLLALMGISSLGYVGLKEFEKKPA